MNVTCLEDVVLFDDGIERDEYAVDAVDELRRGCVGTHLVEPERVAEQDRHLVKHLQHRRGRIIIEAWEDHTGVWENHREARGNHREAREDHTEDGRIIQRHGIIERRERIL